MSHNENNNFQFENEFKVTFPAKSQNERLARVMVSGFVSEYDPVLSLLNDIKTAVSEAVTNAIIHGYDGDINGNVELFCGYKKGTLYIEITDSGLGIDNINQVVEPLYTSKPELERSGMGFTIMESFMDMVEIKSSLGGGTKIIMEKILSSDADYSPPYIKENFIENIGEVDSFSLKSRS